MHNAKSLNTMQIKIFTENWTLHNTVQKSFKNKKIPKEKTLSEWIKIPDQGYLQNIS